MLVDQHFGYKCLLISNAAATGCYFHLTQSVTRKVDEIGIKQDYENNNSLRLALRCSSTLVIVPSSDVTHFFNTS